MNVAEEAHAAQNVQQAGLVGQIPVRNIWLLMLYASRPLRYLNSSEKKNVEENPDDIPDLVAEILVSEVTQRMKRNLSFAYRKAGSYLGTRARQNRCSAHGTGPSA